MLSALRQRLRRPAPPPPPPVAVATPAAGVPTAPRSPLLVDASTWTFWSRGASAAETLVEAPGHETKREGESISRRVAAMLEARDRTRHGAAPVVPRRGDPAQAELLFVELMRAGQFERAYRLLAPECQARWGSPAAFAQGQEGGGHEQVRHAEIHDVEILDVWPDPDSGRLNREVAELRVEYAVALGEREVQVERVVHMVLVEGRWRSLCYPPRRLDQAAAG